MMVEDRRLPVLEADDSEGTPAVLIVDRDPVALMSMQNMLGGLRYRVFCAATSAAGFAILARQPVHIVISDHDALEDGARAAEGIRFLAGVRRLYPGAVRIVMSRVENADALATAINKAGIHKFVSKEWDAARVRAEINEAFLRLHRNVA